VVTREGRAFGLLSRIDLVHFWANQEHPSSGGPRQSPAEHAG
jgi:hypothetical protein